MINKKTYPILFLKGIESVKTLLKNQVKENFDIVEIDNEDELTITIKDKDTNSDFYFILKSPRLDFNVLYFTILYKPGFESNMNATAFEVKSFEVSKHLKEWIDLIKDYNNVNLTNDDKILHEYEREFYDSFEIIDDDAEVNPFELEKQLAIHNFMIRSIQILRKESESNAELIVDAESIIIGIPSQTKKETIRKLSGFLAKVRKKSIALLKEILPELRKEIIKKLISEGFDFLVQSIN